MQQDKKRKRIYWIVGGVMALAIAAGLIMNGRSTQARAAAQDSEIVTAFIGDLAASASASGQVTARQSAALSVKTPGRVKQVHVRVGDAVKAGDVLIRLDSDNLTWNVAATEQNLRLQEANLANLLEEPNAADVTSAEAAVASAQANLDDLLDGPAAVELAASEANVRAAQASLSSAAAQLGTAQDSITESQIAAAEAALLATQLQQKNAQEANDELADEATHTALLSANQAVASAQARLDALQDGPDTTAAQGSVSSAAARLDGRQADLNLQTAGATEAQIAAAQAQLAQALAALTGLVDGPTTEAVAIAEAEVEQARLALADAEDALAAATITAPFAGVVTAVHVSEGEFASGAVVELVNTANLEVILEVDEVDIGSLFAGQTAAITLETWPDVEIASEVLTIAPSATAGNSALVNYDVHLSLGETDLPVRVGMTANANLITAQKTDALLVPNQAINADREKGTYSVTLVNGDAAQETPVTIGARDGQYTEITSGLNPGDKLLIGNNLPTQSFGPGEDGGRRPPFGGGN